MANYYYNGVTPYIAIRRDNNCPGFKPDDYRTWCGVDTPPHDGYPFN